MISGQAVTVFVSVGALAVSIYGIVERRLTLRKTERVRLTELVDQLTEIDIAESKEQDIDANWFVRRKEVLVQQAVSLLNRSTSRSMTAVEYRLLAIAAEECGYRETADALFKKATTARAGGDLGIQTMYAERSRAMALYRAGRPAEGRAIFERMTREESERSDLERFQLVVTLHFWSQWESPDDAEGRARLEEIAKLAERYTGRITDVGIRGRTELLTDEIAKRSQA
jgi:hypothetical protein